MQRVPLSFYMVRSEKSFVRYSTNKKSVHFMLCFSFLVFPKIKSSDKDQVSSGVDSWITIYVGMIPSSFMHVTYVWYAKAC